MKTSTSDAGSQFVRRALTQVAVVIALVAASLLVTGQAARADDSGDGSVTCNSGEICFRKDNYGADNMRKQFWNGANHGSNGAHGAYKWFYVPGGYLTTELVIDSAQYLRNRDTECTVWVWDIDGQGNWFTYASQGANSGSHMSINPYNNGHSRCGGTAAYNPVNL